MIAASTRTARFHYAIRDLITAALAQERAGRKLIYLNIGDPQAYGFRPPAHVVEAVARAVRDGFTGYAPSYGLDEARHAVAEYATALGAPTDPDQVVMTSGASEAAELLLAALVNEGDEVLVPAPGYPIYPALLQKFGAVARYYPLDRHAGWGLSPARVESLITPRTRALLLINPNNPTGTVLDDATTKDLLALAARHQLLVITDEVYRELCFGKQPTAAAVIAQGMDVPVITLESLSKTHLVPGWRVGWMRYTHVEKMRELALAIGRLANGRLCSPTPTQYAVRPALTGDKSFLADFIGELRRRRDFVVAAVGENPALSCSLPEAAFYVMIQVDDPQRRSDETFVLELLEQTGTLVVPGSGFGTDPSAGLFRLVYLADQPTLGIVFDKLREFLR
jgi:alanine-synthesizing transaminase